MFYLKAKTLYTFSDIKAIIYSLGDTKTDGYNTALDDVLMELSKATPKSLNKLKKMYFCD